MKIVTDSNQSALQISQKYCGRDDHKTHGGQLHKTFAYDLRNIYIQTELLFFSLREKLNALENLAFPINRQSHVTVSFSLHFFSGKAMLPIIAEHDAKTPDIKS